MTDARPRRSGQYGTRPGSRFPPGATRTPEGVNFCVFSRHATRVELLLYREPDSPEPFQAIPLDPARHRSFFFWHVLVEGLTARGAEEFRELTDALHAADRRRYRDYTGCGNSVNCNHPLVTAFIVHGLEYWVENMGVDGFRFDPASVFARGQDGGIMTDLALPVMAESRRHRALDTTRLSPEYILRPEQQRPHPASSYLAGARSVVVLEARP